MTTFTEITKTIEVTDFHEVNELLNKNWVLLSVLPGIKDNSPAFVYSLGYPQSAVEADYINSEIEQQRKERESLE
ncbi:MULTISPECIES: hypothetical protein [Lysinibacillus]|uniref:Uncharacterized protein n=1 Tax=Lysinibacillus capsici TaxID=2115968 RepID=A0A2X0XII6_9BACI|nr:hypothetical protein [Lysinibacillus capsici]SPT98759.1 Uncharacterised protein [Lysinibacillus capsici]